jgi:hypothetical protein
LYARGRLLRDAAGTAAGGPEARPTALDLPAVAVTDHPPEHAIETQLPLMLLALGPWITLLPVLVGHPHGRFKIDPGGEQALSARW